jgi:hypothetical protein
VSHIFADNKVAERAWGSCSKFDGRRNTRTIIGIHPIIPERYYLDGTCDLFKKYVTSSIKFSGAWGLLYSVRLNGNRVLGPSRFPGMDNLSYGSCHTVKSMMTRYPIDAGKVMHVNTDSHAVHMLYHLHCRQGRSR